MDQDERAEILEYLLGAAHELDEARAAADLHAAGDNDAASLKAFLIKLNSELLEMIFDRFGDEIPFEEFPEISSTLRWEAVKLPASIPEATIDEIIFSVLHRHWRKMAMILALAAERCTELKIAVAPEIIAARIDALAEADVIESQGDLRKWRHSEARLKPSGPTIN
jgi:hypothetical protein